MKSEDLVKCYSCHKPLLREQVIEGQLVQTLHPERVETQFYLNNNSRMNVSICMDCEKMDLDNPILQNKIMKNVIDGWQTEQDILLEKGLITKNRSEEIMNYHRGLAILFKSQYMDDYQVIARCKNVNN
jgi:hypothetical protein